MLDHHECANWHGIRFDQRLQCAVLQINVLVASRRRVSIGIIGDGEHLQWIRFGAMDGMTVSGVCIELNANAGQLTDMTSDNMENCVQ